MILPPAGSPRSRSCRHLRSQLRGGLNPDLPARNGVPTDPAALRRRLLEEDGDDSAADFHQIGGADFHVRFSHAATRFAPCANRRPFWILRWYAAKSPPLALAARRIARSSRVRVLKRFIR